MITHTCMYDSSDRQIRDEWIGSTHFRSPLVQNRAFILLIFYAFVSCAVVFSRGDRITAYVFLPAFQDHLKRRTFGCTSVEAQPT